MPVLTSPIAAQLRAESPGPIVARGTAPKDNARAKKLLQRWGELKTLRSPWEYYWQEVNDLVRPNTQAFQQSYTQGAPRTRKIFEGTAMLACAECAAGIQGMTCNAQERWFNVTAYDKQLVEDDDALLWMEIVSDIIYMHLSFPKSGFNTSISEVLQDEVAYGTGCIYSYWKDEAGQMRFRTFPLASCYIAEDEDGNVDTLFRTEKFTCRQAEQKWGEGNLPKRIYEQCKEKPDTTFTFMHCVYPRTDRNPGLPDNMNMAWVSEWMWIGDSPNQTGAVISQTSADGEPVIVEEGGYNEFCYQVPRWKKISGETYGRSPAQDAMPDIKTIQSMTRITLIAAEKVIDPPILIPDDGFVSPFKTVPGSLIKYEASLANGDIRNMVVPLETRGNIGIGTDLIERYSDRIERAFHVDQFRAARKKERQSVPEIQDDRGQQMQMLAPILARQEPELFGPLVMRVWRCLKRAGQIPPAPRSMLGAQLHLEFTSQAARAQMFGKAAVIPQFLQALTPLAQVNQAVMDVIDTDESARQLAEAMDITRKVIRSKRDIGQIRQKRQQDQDAQQAAANGAQMASAAKDLATAKATGEGVAPGQTAPQ